MKKLAKFVLWWLFGIFSFALVAPTLAQSTVPGSVPWGWFGNVDNTAWIAVWWTWANQEQWLIQIIKNAINRVLWILGLIVLVLLLRGGFQMVTAAGDETKYKAWFKILKQAAMGLAFIAVSRFMVSIIFRLLGSVTWTWNEVPPQW